MTLLLVIVALIVGGAALWMRYVIVLLNKDFRILLAREVELKSHLDEAIGIFSTLRKRIEVLENEVL